MEKVRDACNTALRIRNEQRIRVRQPLAQVTFIGVADGDLSAEFQQLVLDEINVKLWVNLGKEEIVKYADYKLKINFPVLAKRLSQKIKDIVAANKSGAWKIINNKVEIAGCLLDDGEFELNLVAKEEYKACIGALSSNDALVLVDLDITKELELEGVARDIVRAIQQTRKELDLNITDKIRLRIATSHNLIVEAIEQWQEYIKEQTLAIELDMALASHDTGKLVALDVGEIKLQISKL